MIAADGSKLNVSGRLTLQTVADLFAKGLPFTHGTKVLTVDFSGVEAVDSSAISLMLCWLRSAQRNQVEVSFRNVPDNLRSLANLYGVVETLGLPADS